MTGENKQADGNASATPRRWWTLNPLARKRWQRFRRHRRGFASLCILAALYLVSLGAELICNDKPLFVRFEGANYFPVFAFYPDDEFTGSGRMTRPDYKAIERSAAFTNQPGHLMVFPPFRHGPYEIVKPDTLRPWERVFLVLRTKPRVAAVHVDANLAVTRMLSPESFFDSGFTGAVDAVWAIPPEMLDAVGRRFANTASPALFVAVTNRADPSVRAEISLLAYTPRAAAPRDVRLTFREAEEGGTSRHQLEFRRDGTMPRGDRQWLDRLDETNRTAIERAVQAAFEKRPEVLAVTMDGRAYEGTTRYEEVRWPYRPVPGHWMGIDSAGRDVLARILYGLRTSMTFGLLLVLVSMGLGIAVGAVQGFHGGKVDLLGQRLIEIWSTIPFLYVMILLGSMYGRSFSLLLFCYALFNWIGISYYVRAEFLRLRHSAFVDAARCLGLSPIRIMMRHILPSALTPIITFLPFSLVGAIGSLAILDFLGFGLPPPTPSWGELLEQAQAFRWAWWLIAYPSAALFAVILLVVFIGEGVRDAYDPRPVTRME